MKSLSQSRPARRFWMLLPLLLLLALFGLIAWAGLNGDVPRFDSAAWQAAQTNDQLRDQRYAVLDDLRQNYLRYGTSRAQVLEWLGAPDALTEPPAASDELVYPVGSGDLFKMDRYFLHIYFDQQGRLLETNVLER